MQLVAVPGLGLDERSLRTVLDAVTLLTGVPSRVVHLPGMGARGGGTLEGNARQLVAATGGEPAVLLGHSASCQVVARAARDLEVHGLVLLGPTTDPRARQWPRLALSMGETAVHEPLWQVPLLLRQYSRTGPVSMLRTMDHLRRQAITEDLEVLDVPVLVLRGVSDRVADEAWSSTCAGLGGPGSRSLSIPGAHALPQTAPEEVARAVAAFVLESAPRRASAPSSEMRR